MRYEQLRQRVDGPKRLNRLLERAAEEADLGPSATHSSNLWTYFRQNTDLAREKHLLWMTNILILATQAYQDRDEAELARVLAGGLVFADQATYDGGKHGYAHQVAMLKEPKIALDSSQKKKARRPHQAYADLVEVEVYSIVKDRTTGLKSMAADKADLGE